MENPEKVLKPKFGPWNEIVVVDPITCPMERKHKEIKNFVSRNIDRF